MAGRLRQAFDLRANVRDVLLRPAQRLPMIDGIRALSILYVMVFHSLIVLVVLLPGDGTGQFRAFLQQTPWYWQWVPLGDRSVDVFFVISGLLIGQILFREYRSSGSIDLKRFFVRRWLRLTPVYWLVIAVFAVAAGPSLVEAMVQEKAMARSDALAVFWSSMAAYALYLNNFLPYEQSYYLPFAWSLAVEEQFYILFSLFVAVAWRRLKRPMRVLLGLFVLSFVVRAWLFYRHPYLLVNGDELLASAGGAGGISAAYREIIYDNLYSRFGALVLGIMLAWLSVYYRDALARWFTPRRSQLVLLAALALMLLMSVLPVFTAGDKPLWMVASFHIAHRNLFSLGVALLILVLLQPQAGGALVNRLLAWRGWYPVAQLSYAMYLVHVPLLVLCAGGLQQLGLLHGLDYRQVLLLTLLSLPPVLLFSLLVFVLVERPFMKLRRP